MNGKKKQTGRVNYVWILAGGYLLYLATQLLYNVVKGTSDSPPVGIAGGTVFCGYWGLFALEGVEGIPLCLKA